jgi:hypothetical protein
VAYKKKPIVFTHGHTGRRKSLATAGSLIVAALFAFLLHPAPVFADEDLTALSVFKFFAGMASAAVIHEGAHAVAAEVTDTSISWEAGNYNQPIAFTTGEMSTSQGFAVYSAGLIAQAATAEIILDVDRIDKNDAFVRGMMAWNIVNPILYALDYWVFRRSNQENGRTFQGDIEGVEHYSGEAVANAFAASMAAIAVFQGYRFLKTQDWAPDWVKSEKHTVTMAPCPSGGFVLSYEFRF